GGAGDRPDAGGVVHQQTPVAFEYQRTLHLRLRANDHKRRLLAEAQPLSARLGVMDAADDVRVRAHGEVAVVHLDVTVDPGADQPDRAVDRADIAADLTATIQVDLAVDG